MYQQKEKYSRNYRSDYTPEVVNAEKKSIYEPTIPYFCHKYSVNDITVTGLFFGARGTVSKLFVEWRGIYKLQKSIENEIVIAIIKYSVAILKKSFIWNSLYIIYICINF